MPTTTIRGRVSQTVRFVGGYPAKKDSRLVLRIESAVVMSARAMYVAVIQLIGRSIANVRDFNLEIQSKAGHRMIAVQDYLVIVYADYRKQLKTFRRLRLKLHTRQYLLSLFKGRFRYRLNKVVVSQAIRFFRRNADLELVAHGATG